MKPKYPMTLGEITRYYHTRFSRYNVDIYVDNKLCYSNLLQCEYEFGHDYLSVVEYFRNDKEKNITIYTKEN